MCASEGWAVVATALQGARQLVVGKWERREAGGHDVDEEQLTGWLLEASEEAIQFVKFSRPQEHMVGADWLWWFLDNDGTCFGMLTQAKKLNGKPGRWKLDLAYESRTRKQMESLRAAADRLDVPASYMLYIGTRQRRPDISCSDNDPPDCWRCERASIAVLPALVASQVTLNNSLSSADALARDAYRNAVPLDDLALADTRPIRDLNLRHVGPELRNFLLTEQGGARAIAHRIFRCVSDVRSLQFGLALAEREVSAASAAMFDDLPTDRGHFGVSYFEHILRGLRRYPPDYLADLPLTSTSIDPPPELDGLAGIVVVHL